MKKILLAILILIQFPVLSQSLDGKFQLGGSASYRTFNSEHERYLDTDSIYTKNDRNTFEILPQFGYFINDNVSIGAQIGYIRSSSYQNYQSNQTGNREYNITDNIFLIGAFTRVHKSISENLYLFLHGDMRIGFGKEKSDENPINNQNHLDFRAGIQPGILYMISERIGIEGKFGFLGYNSTSSSLVDSNDQLNEKTERFNLSFNPSNFGLGIQVYL